MPVTIDVKRIGTFSKLPDKTTLLGGFPLRLNEDKRLYGTLSEELDLTIGCDGFKDVGSGDKFGALCDYIQKTSKQGSSLKETIDADFVSNPRILNALARSAYSDVPVEVQAIRQNDVIFLYDKSSDIVDSSIPYVHKFKQYMTLNKDGNPQTEYDKLSNRECFNAVHKATITSGNSNLKVVYTSKVDAVDGDGNFVEMKTTAFGHKKWLEKQSLRHYFQSFFANVPYVIYGRRTSIQEQRIYKVDKILTKSIPNERVYWKEEICLEQLFNVLQEIETTLEYGDEATVVKVTKDGIRCEIGDVNESEFIDPMFLRHFE